MQDKIKKFLYDLFPINRSISGPGTRETLDYIKGNFLPRSIIKSIKSGSKIFDWTVPPEWSVKEAYIKNKFGEKIIDFSSNNIHLVSYSEPVKQIIDTESLLEKIHTLPDHPDWIPYRTSYYKRNWGFCCEHNLLSSKKFTGPFEVKIDSNFDDKGQMNWLECSKIGELKDEIIISTYCCHPSLANDNLSGLVAATLLFEYISKRKTKYSYRLVIAPETIGTVAFLSQANTKNIIGGMIMTCVAGPGNFSIKEGFDKNHWINKSALHAVDEYTNSNFDIFPFVPDGSDERQYSSPGFKIVTPSIHKSKYYEYDEYHTSADNLDFISSENLEKSLEIYISWFHNIENFCHPRRLDIYCEFQLGKVGLYPQTGGSINQPSLKENQKLKDDETPLKIEEKHIDAFQWLMHLSDGNNSNLDIAEKSNLPLKLINESIKIMLEKNLISIS